MDNFSEQLIQKTLFNMHEKKLMPGELLHSPQSYDENNLYILTKGEIEI